MMEVSHGNGEKEPEWLPSSNSSPPPELRTPEPQSVQVKKSLIEAYILCLPLGFLGLHHFYLQRPGWGVLYIFTFGLLGYGWMVDLFRMPCLVQETNKRLAEGHTWNCPRKKTLSDAYILWFPFGLFGAHHFYLGRPGWGFLYFFTIGLFGIGWLIDCCRLPHLVQVANDTEPTYECDIEKDVCTAYVLTLPPLTGLLGVQHYYLRRYCWGVFYTLTLGVLGLGYLVDWARISSLVKDANRRIKEGDDGRKRLDDAYLMCFPFGFLGLHHFYLKRPGWGCLYIFTFGLLGLGWVLDWFRLPCLVNQYNKKITSEGLLPRRPCPYHHQHPMAPPIEAHGGQTGLPGYFGYLGPQPSSPPSYLRVDGSLSSYALSSSELPSSNVDAPIFQTNGFHGPQVLYPVLSPENPPPYSPNTEIAGHPPSYQNATRKDMPQ